MAIIGGLVVWGVKHTIQELRHVKLACMLATWFPAVTSKKMFQLYRDAEADMRCVEGADEDRAKLVNEPLPPVRSERRGSMLSEGSTKVRALSRSVKRRWCQ